ncbi:GNAT family N-acetyltransferase [Halocalculus aciditolerans]|uniref:BioF2-like acetyltransferase domain-containing protein n=1 Tax=Halocalculus aciditolerans TaxID=1383812 RepID=A0A830FAK2_9EURY|nr:GNAT family N-acetyltransferase [Halocalculus aciditolerans]GGL55921.1 hypothetical protein GCM10009039_12640 [Halocalculus aciditolerans]
MPSEYELRSADPEREAWTAAVADHPEATPFHTREWCRAVDVGFDYDPAHRFVYETGSDALAAVVPGFSISGLGGRTVVNPFCEYGFPLLTPEADEVGVFRALAADVGPLGARVVKDARWRGARGYNPAGYGATETGAVIRIDADRDYDAVRETEFASSTRRCLRSAATAGLTLREGTVEEYYPIYLATMRRLGSPQFPRSFLTALETLFGDDCHVFLADDADGETVGGLLALDHDGTRMVWSNASYQRAWEARPNHFLYAAAIEDACAGDLDVFDCGRSRPGSTVHDFKAAFGGREFPLASFVTPAHRTGRASLEGYSRAGAITPYLGGVITNRAVGPRLKRFIHE